MKSAARILALVSLLVALGWGAYVWSAPEPPPLAGLVPRGAILYLEAKDFQSLLADWSSSPEKQQWLRSSDASVFSHSALFLRLQKAKEQFTAAAGIPPDMQLLSDAAGRGSALGLYDIGKLQFLYVTRLPSAQATRSALWQARTKFETRTAAGVTFFVHTDAESGRTVAFAVTDEYLLLATREDLVASALSLISGGAGDPVSGEPWFAKAIAAATAASHQPGDLRMVLNLERVAATPQFRSYWIQRNVSDIKQYSAGVCDLYRSGQEYREERILLRASTAPAAASAASTAAAGSPKTPAGASAPATEVARTITPEGTNAAGDLSRFVPEDAGYYRAIANPTVDESLALLVGNILAPHLGPAPTEKIAPGVALGEGVTGSATDLETRIDQAPPERTALKGSTDALRAALETAAPTAALAVESSRTSAAHPFVTLHSALVLRAPRDWDGEAIRAAIAAAVEPALSTSALGVAWKQNGSIKNSPYALDGLMQLLVATRGTYLYISDDADLLSAVLARYTVRADTAAAVYLAGFNHSRERAPFAHLTRTLDRSSVFADSASANSEMPADDAAQSDASGEVPQATVIPGRPQIAREPYFFSENIASLSRSLSRVNSVSVSIRDSGSSVVQTVIYRWTP